VPVAADLDRAPVVGVPGARGWGQPLLLLPACLPACPMAMATTATTATTTSSPPSMTNMAPVWHLGTHYLPLSQYRRARHFTVPARVSLTHQALVSTSCRFLSLAWPGHPPTTHRLHSPSVMHPRRRGGTSTMALGQALSCDSSVLPYVNHTMPGRHSHQFPTAWSRPRSGQPDVHPIALSKPERLLLLSGAFTTRSAASD